MNSVHLFNLHFHLLSTVTPKTEVCRTIRSFDQKISEAANNSTHPITMTFKVYVLNLYELMFLPFLLGSLIRTLWPSSGTLSSVFTLACQPIRSVVVTPLVSSATSSPRNTTILTSFSSKGMYTKQLLLALFYM